MLSEFKKFAMRGNVIDMGVGIIIGGAFGKIVSSLVTDVIMPPIGLVIGGVDFSDLSVTLKRGTDTIPAVTLNYGLFLNTAIDFVIVAFALFLLIRGINRMSRKQETPTPALLTKDCPECAMAIPIKAKRCGYCNTIQQ
jgi:large conductance mechanosensitive channel